VVTGQVVDEQVGMGIAGVTNAIPGIRRASVTAAPLTPH
jgi:hypothetical protein